MHKNKTLDIRLSPLLEKISMILADSKKRNEKFSMRAFARKIGIPHSTLSVLLNNQRSLTPMQIEKIGKGLNLDDDEIYNIKKFYELEQNNMIDQPDRLILNLKNAKLMTTWYICALFELIKCSFFKNDPAWIATTLNITETEVKEAFEVLKDVGLITIENGVITRATDNYDFTLSSKENFPTTDFKKLQRDLGTFSLKALDTLSTDQRFNSSLIVPFNAKNIHFVKRLSDRLRVKINSYSEEFPGIKNQVYAMTISFYPVSEKIESPN